MKLLKRIVRRHKGFTLIELIIVISVIAILSGVVIAVINPTTFQGKSRDARRQTDLTAIQSALELYYAANRAYPDVNGAVCSNNSTRWSTAGGDFYDKLVPTYIPSIPVDPTNEWAGGTGHRYCYVDSNLGVGGSPQNYELVSYLIEFDAPLRTNDGGDCACMYEVGTDLDLLDVSMCPGSCP